MHSINPNKDIYRTPKTCFSQNLPYLINYINGKPFFRMFLKLKCKISLSYRVSTICNLKNISKYDIKETASLSSKNNIYLLKCKNWSFLQPRICED